jgi:hypothetical protein
MRNSHASLLLILLSTMSFGQAAPVGGAPGQSGQSAPVQAAPVQPASGQTSPGHTPSGPAATPAAAHGAPGQKSRPAPSSLLQPALDSLLQAVGAVQIEKWKKGSVREEATANVGSIQRDLQSTLPALLKEADAASGMVSKVIPVARNIDALYDVVLRVVDAAQIAAPPDQFTRLQAAMTGLEKARHALSDQMQETAAAQEKQIGDLQVALKAQPVPVCPVAPAPAPAPATAKKPAAKKRKPAAKPATTPPAGTTPPAPATTPKPSNP